MHVHIQSINYANKKSQLLNYAIFNTTAVTSSVVPFAMASLIIRSAIFAGVHACPIEVSKTEAMCAQSM
eukprot:m.210535 g.210535  ORF g.210535 m.210535 type:complete len:69 (-) comp33080_c0_seq4:1925-2131(-)